MHPVGRRVREHLVPAPHAPVERHVAIPVVGRLKAPRPHYSRALCGCGMQSRTGAQPHGRCSALLSAPRRTPSNPPCHRAGKEAPPSPWTPRHLVLCFTVSRASRCPSGDQAACHGAAAPPVRPPAAPCRGVPDDSLTTKKTMGSPVRTTRTRTNQVGSTVDSSVGPTALHCAGAQVRLDILHEDQHV